MIGFGGVARLERTSLSVACQPFAENGNLCPSPCSLFFESLAEKQGQPRPLAMAVTGARPQENQAEPFRRRRFTGPARFSLGPWTRARRALPGARLPGQAASGRWCERRCEDSSLRCGAAAEPLKMRTALYFSPG